LSSSRRRQYTIIILRAYACIGESWAGPSDFVPSWCHLAWDGPTATEPSITWFSDGLRIYIICINFDYVPFWIILLFDVSSSDLEFCGTIRFGIYSFPTLGATLPRTGFQGRATGAYGSYGSLRESTGVNGSPQGGTHAGLIAGLTAGLTAGLSRSQPVSSLVESCVVFLLVWPDGRVLSCSWGKRLTFYDLHCMISPILYVWVMNR
jgi:hypothetical protein